MKRQRKGSTKSLQRKVDITMCILTLLIVGNYNKDSSRQAITTTTAPTDHVQQVPDDYMSMCLNENLEYIPLGLGDDGLRKANPYNESIAMPTHLEAHTGRWNEELFVDAQVGGGGGDCWMMGASLHMDLTRRFLQTNKDCKLHAFEPIPFYAHMKDVQKVAASVHEYGLGLKSDTFQVMDININDPVTSSYWYTKEVKRLARSGGAGGRIEPFSRALQDAGGSYPNALILYCQGCEHSVLPAAASVLEHISTIMFVYHQYPVYRYSHRTTNIWQYCEIQYLLQQTHVKTGGFAYGWERWELKQKSAI